MLAVRKMHLSPVKNGFFRYFFSPILFLTLLDITFKWGVAAIGVLLLLPMMLRKDNDHHGDFDDFGFCMTEI
jgi:hypothetical protein